MILVMTNRKLSLASEQEGDVTVSEMGTELAEREGNKDVLRTGILDKNIDTIRFCAKGKEADLFGTISTAEKNRPWVFFVHGFHQDPVENTDKARALAEHHQVNVIAFAWPSRPQDESYDSGSFAEDFVKGILKKASITSILTSIFVNTVLAELKDRWKNYPLAIQNAEDSGIDLIAAMQLIPSLLQNHRPPVLLVHSMGNYLVKKAIQHSGTFPQQFGNIVLHQADVNSDNQTWVEKLLPALDRSSNQYAKLYITLNTTDSVLGASYARRVIKNDDHAERLGHTRHHFIEGDVHYVDFTDGYKVNTEHEFFKFPEEKTNTEVFKLLDRVFGARDDELPTAAEASSGGFTKMPTKISLYWLQYILDELPDEEGTNEPELIESLAKYKNQLKKDNMPEEDQGD